MDKKTGFKCFLITLLVLLHFLFVPNYTVYAFFQDKDVVRTDIKLELGSIDLEFNNPRQPPNDNITLETNNERVCIQVPEIKNNGSLDGKAFYKIDLYQMENGKMTKVSNEMIDHPGNKFELTIQTKGNKSNKITSNEVGQFLPVLEQNNQLLILQSDEIISTTLLFSSNNMNHVDGYKIELTYLMMQTNGTLEKPMFHDEITMSYEIKLDKKNSFWSEGKEVKTAGSFRYVVELSENFYFNEQKNGILKQTLPQVDVDSNVDRIQNNEQKNQLLKEEVSSTVDSISGNQKEVEKELPNQVKDSSELSKETESSVIPKNKENSISEGQKELPDEQKEEPADQAEEPEKIFLPTEDQFKYLDLTFNEETYNIGVTQDQFNWLLNFKTIQEFSDQLTENTPALYVKYDQVTGIEDIQQFVYQLAEEKQLDFEIKLKDIPEHKLLEITFTK